MRAAEVALYKIHRQFQWSFQRGIVCSAPDQLYYCSVPDQLTNCSVLEQLSCETFKFAVYGYFRIGEYNPLMSAYTTFCCFSFDKGILLYFSVFYIEKFTVQKKQEWTKGGNTDKHGLLGGTRISNTRTCKKCEVFIAQIMFWKDILWWNTLFLKKNYLQKFSKFQMKFSSLCCFDEVNRKFLYIFKQTSYSSF